MITIRPAVRPQDIEAISRIDTSFVTDRIYRLRREGLSVEFVEEKISPPLEKRYPFNAALCAVRVIPVLVAEVDGNMAGVALMKHGTWDGRSELAHLYVDPEYRRMGVGTQLLDAAYDLACKKGTRGLHLETQNVNYAAVRFYLRSGMRFCGYHDCLYDPKEVPGEEIALFFFRPIVTAAGKARGRKSCPS